MVSLVAFFLWTVWDSGSLVVGFDAAVAAASALLYPLPLGVLVCGGTGAGY